jgi:hypothetical protein
VTYFESHISEIVFPRQPIWKFLGNRFVEALIHGDIQAEETELVDIGIPVAVLGICISSRVPESDSSSGVVVRITTRSSRSSGG